MKTHIVNYGSKITYLYLSLLYLRLFYGITFIEIRPCKGKNSQKSKIREAKLQKYKVRKRGLQEVDGLLSGKRFGGLQGDKCGGISKM